MSYTESEVSQKILSATFELLSKRGYANVSMRDIAKKSGVAVSQITYYYKTKENLLSEVTKKAVYEYLNELKQKLKEVDSPNERMPFFFDQIKKLMVENTNLYRLLLDFYSLATWNREIQKEFKLIFNEMVSLLCGILNQIPLKNTPLYSYSHEQAAKLIVGSCLGIAMQYVMDENDKEAVSSLKIMKNFFA